MEGLARRTLVVFVTAGTDSEVLVCEMGRWWWVARWADRAAVARLAVHRLHVVCSVVST